MGMTGKAPKKETLKVTIDVTVGTLGSTAKGEPMKGNVIRKEVG